MPVPSREKNEDKDLFVSRCISSIIDEYGQEQAAAICYKAADEKMSVSVSNEVDEVFVLTPNKTENRGKYLQRCSAHPKMKEQFKDMKERMGQCLNAFNSYYKYWSRLEAFGEKDVEGTILGDCITKKRAQGLDYKEAYARCASKVVAPSGPIVLSEDEDNLIIEPVSMEGLDEFAEIGPRGGIKESKKAPKSDTPNKDPQGEGTAKGKASGKRGAVVTAEQEKTLQKKVDDFNEKDSNTKNGRATLGSLKSVFQRGLGAYNTSHSPKVQSSEQWAYARVNAFLYLLKNGRPENPKYDTDFDLLPKDHPKAQKMSVEGYVECDECGWEWQIKDGGDDPFICHKCGYDNAPSKQDFVDTYNDYPESVKNNAKRAVDWAEKNGWGSCGTAVGKQRASQLAKGENISVDTIKRMYSYLSRHKVDLQSSKSFEERCGYLMYMAWGGESALGWAERKLKQLEKK
jgi:hypothetical protein